MSMISILLIFASWIRDAALAGGESGAAGAGAPSAPGESSINKVQLLSTCFTSNFLKTVVAVFFSEMN